MMSTENQVDDKTKELVGECIRQAFGNLKDYLDINLAKQKQDNDRLLQSTSQQVVEFPGGLLSTLVGTHARHKKRRKGVEFWPSGVDDVFRKRGPFQRNLRRLGLSF